MKANAKTEVIIGELVAKYPDGVPRCVSVARGLSSEGQTTDNCSPFGPCRLFAPKSRKKVKTEPVEEPLLPLRAPSNPPPGAGVGRLENGPWLNESSVRSTLEDGPAEQQGGSDGDAVENGIEASQREC